MYDVGLESHLSTNLCSAFTLLALDNRFASAKLEESLSRQSEQAREQLLQAGAAAATLRAEVTAENLVLHQLAARDRKSVV